MRPKELVASGIFFSTKNLLCLNNSSMVSRKAKLDCPDTSSDAIIITYAQECICLASLAYLHIPQAPADILHLTIDDQCQPRGPDLTQCPWLLVFSLLSQLGSNSTDPSFSLM